MITAFDDYPIHQTTLPVAIPGTTDPNAYDRFWFNGFVGDGSLYFGVSMCFYPNRHVLDGAFSVLAGGYQYSLHISGEAPLERSKAEIGPLRIETIVPMRRHRVVVNDPQRGFEADILFEGGTGTHEEARQITRDGVRTVMDVTRASQFGSWSGRIVVKGMRIELDARLTNGCRDRSWGVRPCGERAGRPNKWATQLYFGWSPTFWDDFVLHGVFFDNEKGDMPLRSGAVIPRVPKGDEPVFARDAGEIEATPCGYQFDYISGTRRIKQARMQFRRKDGEMLEVEYEPLVSFQMAGLGYFHPTWGHGMWKGPYAIEDETWNLDELDIKQPHLIHVQQVCKTTLNGKQTRCGILEHAAFGPHEPSGFKELFDGYRREP